jgi:ATP-binding cassette subfamily A (ABC1) protein 3
MNLSGGNKRKLICAMTLIGNPQIEFMDEPTTGVDPVSCRSLFKILKNLEDSSLILTTHRMDEAESLCDNIVIMINGRFVCYGSPGQIKSKYGTGYSVWMVSPLEVDQLERKVYKELPQLYLVPSINPHVNLSSWRLTNKSSE